MLSALQSVDALPNRLSLSLISFSPALAGHVVSHSPRNRHHFSSWMRRLRRENTAPRRNDSTTTLRVLALFNPLHFARVNRKLATDSVHLLRQLMRRFKKRRAQELLANKNRHIRCLLSLSQRVYSSIVCFFFMFSYYTCMFCTLNTL